MNFETVRFGFPVEPENVDVCVTCDGSGEEIVPSRPPLRMKYVREIDGAETIDCHGCDGYRLRDDDGEGVPVVPAEASEAAA